MNNIQGKTAIVTGGSRGIGRCIATELASRGANVAINYCSSEAQAEEVAREVRACGVEGEAIQGDLGRMDQARQLVERVLDQWGRVDILVNNAGITRDKSMRNLTDADWKAVVDLNLNAVYATCSAAWPATIEQKYGRIVNITSFVGQAGNYGQANYAASKGGIIAFTKSMALEVARYNITVNAIAPGFIGTDMLAQVPDKIRDKLLSRIPMGRFGQPQEVARTVAYIATEGDYITGQQINVNGGVYM